MTTGSPPLGSKGRRHFALRSSSLPTSSLPFTQGHFMLDKTSECSKRAASSAPRDVLRPASLTRAKYATSSPRLLIHHLDDFQGHRRGLLLVYSRLFHLPSSPAIISHRALLPRRIFHMPYLILRRLTLRRHDIPACSDTPPLPFVAH